jgi:hypothetical protein
LPPKPAAYVAARRNAQLHVAECSPSGDAEFPLQGSRGPNWTPDITGWTPDM